MFPHECQPNRRDFLRASALFAAGVPVIAFSTTPALPAEAEANVLGPRQGYSPQIGTLVSMMTWMRDSVLRSVKGMSQQDLDFLLDAKANTIGALLLHLAATDRLYQINTFENKPLKEIPKDYADKFGVAMQLGEPARKTIKGNSLDFYLNLLGETRAKTLAEFRKRDDAWMLAVDKTFPWGPTNNLCKWFHVCEHESNHNGQIKLLKARLPGAKSTGE